MKKCLKCAHRFNVITGAELKCPGCGATGAALVPTFYGDTNYKTPLKDE